MIEIRIYMTNMYVGEGFYYQCLCVVVVYINFCIFLQQVVAPIGQELPSSVGAAAFL